MLRGRTQELQPDARPASTVKPSAPEVAGFPGPDQPYATDAHPPGVLFYVASASFFLPYHLLQSMDCTSDQLTLRFPKEDVVIAGRGLHELYIQLAAHRVWRVVEQGERYAALSPAGLFVTSIARVTRETEEPHKRGTRK